MAAPYEPPEWASNGQNTFNMYLDVIRNGVLVETLALPLDPAKSFVVAGRMEPVCDLVLQHPSLSRVHAVLQFDAQGGLFLQDMKSTHGTFVNKKRVVPLQFQRLRVGDLLEFGESTRKYAVCGPDELRPEEPDMIKLRAKIQASNDALKKREDREASGASWGFREDAEEDDEEDDASSSEDDENSKAGRGKAEPRRRQGGGTNDGADLPEYLRGLKEPTHSAYESSVKGSDVSEKDQKLFTQLQNKIRKMENLEIEKTRILAKQNDLQGLSDGQQQTLDRNSNRIKTLATEIADLEDRIHARTAQRDQSRAVNDTRRKAAAKKTNGTTSYAYDSDKDDFYDRTSANQKKLLDRKQQQEAGKSAAAVTQKKLKPEVLTAEIIERKIAMLEKDLKELNTEYARVQASGDPEKEKEETTEMDALEAFMQSTATELHMKELARVKTRREEVETELAKQRQLLVIAMPALHHKQPTVSSTKPPAEVKESAPTKHESSEPTGIEAEKTKEETGPSSSMVTVEETLIEKTQEGTPSREPQEKPLLPRPREEEGAQTSVATEAKPKKRRLMGPTLPPPVATPSTTTTAEGGAVLEGGDRVWVPPSNQTGDGRTTLNDKYGY